MFQFYSQLIAGIKKSKNDTEIEKLRKKLQLDESVVQGGDFGAGSLVGDKSGKSSIRKIARHGISSPKECHLIAQIIQMKRPDKCIELGTSLGITTSYLSKYNHDGEIYTFEGNPALCEIAKQNWKTLNCKNIKLIEGNIDLTLKEKLAEVPGIDFAIIDANHTKKALLEYYGLISNKINRRGIIYIDDIRWSLEMYHGWEEIVKDPKVNLSLEFLNNGLLFFEKGLMKQHYILSY